MTRSLLALAVTLATFLPLCRGDDAELPKIPLDFAGATGVVVGRVTAVSDKVEKVEADRRDRREMKVATLKVTSVVMGQAADATIKLGAVIRKGGFRKGKQRDFTVKLAKGDEVLVVLRKHPTKKDLYLLIHTDDVIARKGPDFKNYVAAVKKAVTLMADPVAALKSKSADDRLLAAALLIVRYKTYDSANIKTEPVPAAQTKLLFTVLAEADWEKGKAGGDPLMTPWALFQRLRLSGADGWVQPRDPDKIAPAARAWLKANAGSYKLTRSVRNKVTPVPVEEPGR